MKIATYIIYLSSQSNFLNIDNELEFCLRFDLLLFSHLLLLLPIFLFCFWSLISHAALSVLSSCNHLPERERERERER